MKAAGFYEKTQMKAAGVIFRVVKDEAYLAVMKRTRGPKIIARFSIIISNSAEN
jgi:hypothetical protein